MLFVSCLLVVSSVSILGVDGGKMTPGRMGDKAYLDALVAGTMSMMTSADKKQMRAAEKLEASKGKTPPGGGGGGVGRFVAELIDLPASVNCFGLPSWILKPIRKWFEPQASGDVNTHFFLSTRSHRARTRVPAGDEFSLHEMPGFDPRHRTVVIVHGFLAGGNEEWIQDMTNAILDQIDANVFAVDWSGGGGSWKYWKAVANTRVTGNDITRFMTQLINEAGLRKDDVHLVGHSLGAHICGFVSRSLLNVSRITGLDPAQPCFETRDTTMTLDASDATFVDVIHTNGRLLRKIGLGLPYNIGSVDFYPHGGMVQPECQLDKKKCSWWLHLWRIFAPKTYMLYKEFSEAICSHGRAYALFTESLRKAPGCFFWGHPWDMRTATLGDSLDRKCDMDHCSEMGYDSDRYPARGGFFVKATDAPPFCVSDRRTDAAMGMSAGRVEQ